MTVKSLPASGSSLMDDADTRCDFLLQGTSSNPHVVLGLQIEPETRFHLKKQAKAQCRIGRSRAYTAD